MIGLLACAPMGVMPPPVPFAATDAGQVGIAGGVVDAIGAPRPRRPTGEKLEGQLWTELRLGSRARLGFVGTLAGQQGFQAAGVLFRYTLREADTRWVLDLSAGVAWAGVGVAVTRRVGRFDLYVAPSVLVKDTSSLRVPVGAAVPVGRVRIFGEAGLTSSARLLAPDYPYGPMTWGYVTVGAAVAWDRR